MEVPPDMEPDTGLLTDPAALRYHMQHALQTAGGAVPLPDADHPVDTRLSVVLFLLGMYPRTHGAEPEPCLILNKRSAKVRQPGDICCPGGGVAPRFDRMAARLLRLPRSPLRRWAYYAYWRKHAPRRMVRLRLLLATALREGIEEMRLNPFALRFLGALPAEQLVLFRRTIVPLVAWLDGQRRFFPNWEVAKIVRIPLRDLLSTEGYIGLRLRMTAPEAGARYGQWKDFPAFRHDSPEGREILWGATYRITMGFLERVFRFRPPVPTGNKVVEKRLTSAYLTGQS